ncbi:uncharacterized protein LOC125370486 [Ricinus communis]|uniref:uncharacterized protein LOC125370486 n=1 Tax=Ricinus communis TaxID=3988 RepID=UPI00201AF503|nr:uncharacterized protein LOC125370486 [Ricinus communis]
MEGKEKKSSKIDKEANNLELWPDLPQQLIHLIARNSSLLEHICSKGVTKSWRAQASKCRSNPATPWLELSGNRESDHNRQSHVFHLPIRRGFIWYWRRHKPTPPVYNIIGCSHGLIVAKGASASDYNLWDPVIDGYWCIPRWDAGIPFIRAALSSPLPWISRHKNKNKCTVMVLTGVAHPAFAYYRIWEGGEWIRKDSNIVDPNCSDPNRRDHLLQLTNGIWCKEKFYALSAQGTLVVIEDIDFDLRITALGKKRAVPSVSSMHFKEFLVESEGMVLLVFLISRNSINTVDYVEVYQLNTAKLGWIKKESLGERTLFLGSNCCMSVSASKVGCRGNCVYFSRGSTQGWWVYEMDTCTITSINASNLSAVWVEPTVED